VLVTLLYENPAAIDTAELLDVSERMVLLENIPRQKVSTTKRPKTEHPATKFSSCKTSQIQNAPATKLPGLQKVY
jgi:hypothetical protein